MDVELAKHYEAVAGLGMIGGYQSPPNPLLDVLLPSLLYVRLGTILDEALKEYIVSKGLKMGKKHRKDFNGRICFLAAKDRLRDASTLHNIRERRNELAHEITVYDPSQPTACKWSELDQAVDFADSEMQHLGLAGARPDYRFHAGQRTVAEPGHISTDYVYGLLLNGQAVIEVSCPAAGRQHRRR